MGQGKEVGLFLTRDQTPFTGGHVATEVTWNHFSAVGSREGRRAGAAKGRDGHGLTALPGCAAILGTFRLACLNGSGKTEKTN